MELNMETDSSLKKKLLQKEYDRVKYYKDVDKSRRTKLIQKIKREGTIPTQSSIDKYNITTEELLTFFDFLKNNLTSIDFKKRTEVLNKRIKYIKEKNLNI